VCGKVRGGGKGDRRCVLTDDRDARRLLDLVEAAGGDRLGLTAP
jgi:hypothetical protein